MMAARAGGLQGCDTLLAAAEGEMSPDKLITGSGWMGDAEEPPETKQRRSVYERPSCEMSIFGKSSTTKMRCRTQSRERTSRFVDAADYRTRSSRS